MNEQQERLSLTEAETTALGNTVRDVIGRSYGFAAICRAVERILAARAESTETALATARREVEELRGQVLREVADFIEATSGIGEKRTDYADGWYDALNYALGELRVRAALANPSAAQGEGEA